MINNSVFTKFEVIGKTKDEAIAAAQPMNLMVDATQAFNKWKKVTATNDDNIREWMKDYLRKKKFDNKPGVGAYIVLQSAVVDSRQRPYKVTKIKYDKHTHSFLRVYVIRDAETGAEVGDAPTSQAALELAKSLVIANGRSYNINIEAKVKEKNSLYAKVDYTPSAGTQCAKLLVFGYKNIDVD